MKKCVQLLFATISVIALLSGCYLLPEEEESLEPPLIKPAEVEYKIQVIELSDIAKETTIYGKFKSQQEVTLCFEERGGYLITTNGRYGGKVKQGDILFELDTDDMLMEQKVAELNLEKATMYYERVKQRTSSTYERRMAEIDMEIKQVAYDKVSLEISKSKIIAPIDGVITYVSNANVGEYVSAEKVMVKIADETELTLLIQGDDAAKLNMGDTVRTEFTIDKEKVTFEGRVLMSPNDKPENMQESYDEPTAVVEIIGFDTSKAYLNQEARITITEQSAENAVVIKRSAINNYFGRTFVYVLVDGVKEERDVKVGITTNIMAEIVEGLDVGDEVIMN